MFYLDYSNTYTNLLYNSSCKEKDIKSVTIKLGWSNKGGLYTITNDYNLAWKDINYKSNNEYKFKIR